MDPHIGGFSIDHLMELAGLSCAQALAKTYYPSRFPRVLVKTDDSTCSLAILVTAGTNGGDALVAARHLHHFGFKPVVYYPKPGRSTLFTVR
ncbi:YjeF-related protein [Gonapodya prolifera JEL478]|uniref:NAD(P)H-hydrate epimerase n=1 Tax=Gonapodya prolifera (strain JEL478) TaxID=1344416 RepID=A0A139A2F6_GONPJ|nr:YjeF-related protein [Gonapodya prolifera JEL478]|eukprot:KXS10970.1 YjeF-related protein [Gonapodya prolifera JEL478]